MFGSFTEPFITPYSLFLYRVFDFLHAIFFQWRRSVVKYEGRGQSGQKAIELFQAPRKIKFYLPLLTQVSHPWSMWNMQSYRTTVLNERMWYFRGSKHSLTPPTYFQGYRPNHKDLLPAFSTSYFSGDFDRSPRHIFTGAVCLCEERAASVKKIPKYVNRGSAWRLKKSD